MSELRKSIKTKSKKVMKGKIFTSLLFLSLIAQGCNPQKAKIEERVKVIETKDLTLETITQRNGDIIVEKTIGKVTTSRGDGTIINCSNPEKDYISYASSNISYEIGDEVLTYFIYNPDNNIEDDIIFRFDYIINR